MKINFFTLVIVVFLAICMISCEVSDIGDSGDADNYEIPDIAGDSENTGYSVDSICPDNNKFCHNHDGLFWSDMSDDRMLKHDAEVYCENLGGRLPTISELRTLVKNCPATETGGLCKVTNDCLSYTDCWTDICEGCPFDESNLGEHSVFGNTEWFWSSSEQTDFPGKRWYLASHTGHVGNKEEGTGSVRCLQ